LAPLAQGEVAHFTETIDGLSRAISTVILGKPQVVRLPEDIKVLAEVVCAHRLLLTPDAGLREQTGAAVVAQVLAEVAAPHPAAAR
jgi:MoxR-like ATPase